MKYLMLLALASISIVTLAACSSTDKTATTTSSAPMQTDSKEMKK